MKEKKKYNHAYEIAFSLESNNNADHVTKEELIIGLIGRLNDLVSGVDDIVEACGLPFNSYENE